MVEFGALERYSHVWHIVSTVTGEVADGRDAFDVLTACFPAGTLTGAPKVRAMELIDELEPVRRGVYGGAVGYLDAAGDLDMAIAIRTAVMREGTAYVQASAGIVADSDPAAEEQETRNKARAVLQAMATAATLAPPAVPVSGTQPPPDPAPGPSAPRRPRRGRGPGPAAPRRGSRPGSRVGPRPRSRHGGRTGGRAGPRPRSRHRGRDRGRACPATPFPARRPGLRPVRRTGGRPEPMGGGGGVRGGSWDRRHAVRTRRRPGPRRRRPDLAARHRGAPPPLVDVTLNLSGKTLEPLVAGLGVVGLAGVVGLLATRRWGRLVVAAVVTLSGLLVAFSALTRLGAPGPDAIQDLLDESGRAGGLAADGAVTAVAHPAWPLLAAAGGVLLALGGLVTLVRSRRWPTMSARYETPAARADRPRTDAAVWDALSRGDDPTAGA